MVMCKIANFKIETSRKSEMFHVVCYVYGLGFC